MLSGRMVLGGCAWGGGVKLPLLLLTQAMVVLGQEAPPPGPALYAVVAVIVVFIVAIVILSIVIVLLYRKKCGHQQVTTGSGGGSNAYTRDSPGRLEVSLEQKDADTLTNSITKLQSLEIRTQSPPHPPKGAQTSSPPHLPKDTSTHPPPRPPKPVRGEGEVGSRHKQKIKFKVLDGDVVGDYERSPSYKCSSTVVMTFPSPEPVGSNGRERNSSHPADPEHSAEALGEREQPPLDSLHNMVYGLETNDLPDNLKNKYCGNYERSPDYHWCTGSGLTRANTDCQRRSIDGSSSQKGDSIYLSGTDKSCRSSTDSSTNQRNTTDVNSTAVLNGKYHGDYERDPNYMRWQLAQQNLDPSLPEHLPHPQEVMEGRLRVQSERCVSGRSPSEERCKRVRTDKYRGDYDRCETYTFPPPFQLGSVAGEGGSRSCDPTTGITWFHGKYVGNYERDPVYMEKLDHHFVRGEETGTSNHPYTTTSSEHLYTTTTPSDDHPYTTTPSNHPYTTTPNDHPYTTLETSTRQVVQPYSAITHQNSSPDSTPQPVLSSPLDPSLQLVANHQQHSLDHTIMPYADV